MSLGIEAYSKVVRSGVSQLALVSDGQGQTKIVDARETKVGFQKRLFNTEASKRLNIAVTSDFKAAIASKYSARVAHSSTPSIRPNTPTAMLSIIFDLSPIQPPTARASEHWRPRVAR